MHRSSPVAGPAAGKPAAMIRPAMIRPILVRRALARPARVLPILALLALSLPAVLALSGCQRAPLPPAWDNPFDPRGPDDGDPLRLMATVMGGSINLTWDQPQGMGITEYAISHAVHPDSLWSAVTLVAQTDVPSNFYLYENPTPTQSHWFRVQALDADGKASLVDYATPAGVLLGPRVILNHDAGTVASRYLTVKVVVSRGTSLRVSLGPTFSPEETYTAAAPGDTAFIALDAGAGAQGDTVKVRVRSVDGAYTSLATVARARIDFSPDFTLPGGGTTVGSRTVTLAMPAAGITRMRFATSEADLAGAEWTAGAATYTGLLLGANTGAQPVWGEFEGDFGFNSVSHITLTPDLLTGAAFHLAVPQDHVTTTATVRAILTGKATLVRWSEGPNLTASPWLAHADTLEIPLSDGAGLKTIYLQMHNDWNDSPILTDYAVLVARGLEVAFIAPTNGATLAGGIPLVMRGTSYGGGATVDSVKVDLDDGVGFRRVTGRENWSFTWNVPVVDVSTARTLRARAWAGAGTATVSAAVTIAP